MRRTGCTVAMLGNVPITENLINIQLTTLQRFGTWNRVEKEIADCFYPLHLSRCLHTYTERDTLGHTYTE